MKAQKIDPFNDYNLDGLGSYLGHNPSSDKTCNAKFFILSNSLSRKENLLNKKQVMDMFNNLIETMSFTESFVRALYLPKSYYDVKSDEQCIIREEKIQLFEKFMNKWITGKDENRNYFILDYDMYRKLLNSEEEKNFFQMTSPTEINEIFFDALLRQIDMLTKSINLYDLEIWDKAYELLLSPRSSKGEDFFQKFLEAHSESTKKTITVTEEQMERADDDFHKFIAFARYRISDFGYFPDNDSMNRKFFVDLHVDLKQKSIAFMQKKVQTYDLETAVGVKTSIIERLKYQKIDLIDEIAILDQRIISFFGKK